MPELEIVFDDGMSQNLEATPLGGGLYLLDETPLVTESTARLGSIVELKQMSDDLYEFVKVVQEAPGSRQDYVLKAGHSKKQIEAFSIEAERRGVKWELVFENVLILHLPAGIQPEFALKAINGAWQG